MESFKIESLSFSYPNKSKNTLDNINFNVHSGEFVLLCGQSGCGKTTLLRLLKSSLSPFGKISGSIYFKGRKLEEYDIGEQASEIGFVMQNPDNQIVTDKVWHELAFGLESLGMKTPEIRARVSEMASFFGIHNWFYKNVNELSGGQKQLLNLASIMVMQPSVLILDEPTSQLDPIAASEFLQTVAKINRELGVSVILTEHRLEEAFPMADRVIVMDEGRIISDDSAVNTGKILKELNHPMYKALPVPVRVHGEIKNNLSCPLTVREGRMWLEEFSKNNPVEFKRSKTPEYDEPKVIELKEVWFRYGKETRDVVKGLNLQVKKGELYCILGGNGSGKTTALSLISGLNKPCRGEVYINRKRISGISDLNKGIIGVLPQNPQSVFVKNTVRLDLEEMLSERKLTADEKEKKITDVVEICGLIKLLNRHPYDLSGGEQQRAALAKVLLSEPEILLLDEPTKGMDAQFKEEFADILSELKENGVTVVMVSHDIEFCASYADRCALFFDGNITSEGTPCEFFAGKSFYTTVANRMARTVIPDAVLLEDIISACGGTVEKKKKVKRKISSDNKPEDTSNDNTKKKKPSLFRIITGSFLALLFAVTSILSVVYEESFNISVMRLIAAAEAVSALICLFPQREIGVNISGSPLKSGKLSKRTIVAAFMILLLIPLTIYAGVHFFESRKYYFISLLIIIETIIPFCMIFESRKPQARELIIISVLCAIGVAGRGAFFMLPQFKPVIALVIISGVCFGGETGFLVGAVTGFVSNFLFGQGPWTPWQMFAFGIIGFLSGILFQKGILKKTRVSLCVFGFFSTYVIYGGIINPASVIMWQEKITAEMIVSAYITGIPFDIIHSVSTAFFLWIIAAPMIEKLERVKLKYGLIERDS